MTSPDEEAIFHQALEMEDPDVRLAFMASACGGDVELRCRIEELLAAYEASEQLESPAPGIARLADFRAPTLAGATIGRFAIRDLIGAGGMGDVYLAREIDGQQRCVALKVIRPGMDSREVIARFELERQTLSRMDHPHIAKFIESGFTDQGRAYFAMELVRGLPITAYCDRQRLTLAQRLKLFIDLCTAVQHAHAKGMVHRDLKPTNVLVAHHAGEAVVKVIDFGVAKATASRLGDDTLVTWAAQLVGTPLYMSPEQADWRPDVDVRSDVYSLGSMLYEILTGSPPILPSRARGLGLDELRGVILEEEAACPSDRLKSLPTAEAEAVAASRRSSPRQLRLQVRGDLDWITLCALAKNREQRYASAGELGKDLDRFLAHRVVNARKPGWSTRFRKWSRRHARRIFIASATVAAALALIGGYLLLDSLDQAREIAAEARLAASLQTDRQRYDYQVQAPWTHSTADSAGKAMDFLNRSAPPADDPDAVGFEWHYFRGASAPPLQIWRGHKVGVLSADLSPDERLTASGDYAGNVLIWDVASGRLRRRLNHGCQEVTAVKFSPDGRKLATTGMDQVIRLWDTEKWTKVAHWTGHTATICDLDWSPDGRRLASGGRDGLVHIRDALTGSIEKTLRTEADVVRCVAWSPNGEHFASGNGEFGVNLWDVQSWERLSTFEGARTKPLDIAFTADGSRLAFGGYSEILTLVDVATLEVESICDLAAQIWSLRFLDRDRIAVGLDYGMVEVLRWDSYMQLWETDWLARCASKETHREMLLLAGGEQVILACERDKSLQLMDGAGLLGCRAKLLKTKPLGVVAGCLVSAMPKLDRMVVTEVQTNRAVADLSVPMSLDCSPAYCSSSHVVAVAGSNGEISLIDAKTWEIQRELLPSKTLHRLSFSHDGRYLAAGTANGEFWVQDLTTDRRRNLVGTGENGKGLVAFSPTSDQLILATRGSDALHLFQSPEFDEAMQRRTESPVHSLRYFPDGSRIAVGEDDSIAIRDASDLKPVKILDHGLTAAQAIAFSPNRRTLVSIGKEGVRLWDAETGHQFCLIRTSPQNDSCWCEFADRTTLCVGSPEEQTLFQFDANSNRAPGPGAD